MFKYRIRVYNERKKIEMIKAFSSALHLKPQWIIIKIKLKKYLFVIVMASKGKLVTVS